MYLLDTDHLIILDQDTIEGFNLGRRLAAVPPAEVAVSIVTYEEQMRGWLAYGARANTPERQIEAYLASALCRTVPRHAPARLRRAGRLRVRTSAYDGGTHRDNGFEDRCRGAC